MEQFNNVLAIIKDVFAALKKFFEDIFAMFKTEDDEAAAQ